MVDDTTVTGPLTAVWDAMGDPGCAVWRQTWPETFVLPFLPALDRIEPGKPAGCGNLTSFSPVCSRRQSWLSPVSSMQENRP